MPKMLKSLVLVAIGALLALAIPAASNAQANHISAKLLAESPAPVPGGATMVALAMTPDAGWHGYWINGGDAGFGMNIDWTLPDGVTVEPLRYPVPEPLILFGMMNHVYEQPYALLAKLSVSPAVAPGTDLTLSGIARWLACTDKVCVPEQALIALSLKAGAGRISAASRAHFDKWRAQLPQPLDRAGRWERHGDKLRIAIPLPPAVMPVQPHLFVESENFLDYAAKQNFSRNGNWLVIDTKAKGAAGGPIQALLKLEKGRGLSVELRPGTVAAAGKLLTSSAPDPDGTNIFWAALGSAILGGLILNLMPCVFPILSLKALSLTRSGDNAHAARAEALAYTAGAVLVALLLGGLLLLLRAGGEQVGWAFQLQHPVSVFILLLLAIAIMLNLLGVFELPAFGGGHGLAGKAGVAGGFWTGALAAFVATPCSGPLLGAALGATLVLPAWAALPIFGGLGLGLALPFLAIGFIPRVRNRLPKPGPWMAKFRKSMAFPMGLTALALVWLLWRQAGASGFASGVLAAVMLPILAWSLGSLQRKGRPIYPMLVVTMAVCAVLMMPLVSAERPSKDAEVAGLAYSPDAFSAARATGKPVFVYFTADWCLSCKANEAGAINRDVVQSAFRKAGVITLVGDWTNGDPAITRTLAAHGRNSVPLYLWYAPGVDKPEILPQILTPGMLLDRAQ